jgi:hypothetical protein
MLGMGFPAISSASDWIDVLKAFATPAIALIVAIITYQQWRTNQAELRLDLYNRRFAVYLCCLDLRLAILRRDEPECRRLFDPFVRAFRESRFMFPESSSVYRWIYDFYGKANYAINFSRTSPVGQFDPDGLDPEEVRMWPEKREQAFDNVPPIAELEEKLAPLLNFHDL